MIKHIHVNLYPAWWRRVSSCSLLENLDDMMHHGPKALIHNMVILPRSLP